MRDVQDDGMKAHCNMAYGPTQPRHKAYGIRHAASLDTFFISTSCLYDQNYITLP